MSHMTVYPVSGVPACLTDQAEAPPNVAGVSRHSIMNPRIAVRTISISPARPVLRAAGSVAGVADRVPASEGCHRCGSRELANGGRGRRLRAASARVPWFVTGLRELSGQVGCCQPLSRLAACARRRFLEEAPAGTLLEDPRQERQKPGYQHG
jgi:hypothetical protein